MALEGAFEVEFVGDFDVFLCDTLPAAVGVSNVADSCGEGSDGSLVQLGNDSVNEVLIVPVVLVCRHEWLQTIHHVSIKEVPRGSLLEARHAKDIL